MTPKRWRRSVLASAGAATLTAVAVLSLGNIQAHAAGETVSVWVTTADQSKLLAQQPDVTFGSDSGSATTIDVNAGSTFQTMDGFGASFTDSSAWLVANRLNTSQRNTLMNNLFSSSGIGLSMVRQPMGASDFTVNSADYTYDDTCCDLGDFSINHDRAYIIPVLKQAKTLNPQLKIIGSPWSPPAWMKTNNSLNGGQLRADRHSVFADYFVRYAQAYAAEGLPIYGVTMQNEPHHEAGYPSMRMEPQDQAAVAKNHLGPKFAQAGLNTKIIVWDHNWDEANYPIAVLNDSAAKQYIAGSAFHCYAGDVGAQSTVHNAHPDRGLWFTECSGGEWATDFGANLKWNMQNIIIGTTRNWAKSVTLWNMALDQNHGPTNGGCSNCRGVVTINTTNGNVAYNVEYYVLGHAAKFVKPGATRIASSTHAGDIESVGFKNPDGSIALITLNAATSQRTFKVRSAGQAFTYTLPAGAVATFTWKPGVTDPSPTPTATTSPTPSPTASPSPSPTPSPGVINENAYYRVTARHSGKSLDVRDVSTANGALIQQWTYGGGDNQKWRFVSVGGGYYRILAKHSGKALDVRDVSTANGALIQQWDYVGGPNQQWQVVDVGGGHYRIVSRHSGKALDVRDVSTSDGALIQQWTYGGGANQQWTLTQVETIP